MPAPSTRHSVSLQQIEACRAGNACSGNRYSLSIERIEAAGHPETSSVYASAQSTLRLSPLALMGAKSLEQRTGTAVRNLLLKLRLFR